MKTAITSTIVVYAAALFETLTALVTSLASYMFAATAIVTLVALAYLLGVSANRRASVELQLHRERATGLSKQLAAKDEEISRLLSEQGGARGAEAAELDALRAKVEEANEHAKTLEADMKQKSDELEAAETRVLQLTSEQSVLVADRDKALGEVASVGKERDELKSSLDSASMQMRKLTEDVQAEEASKQSLTMKLVQANSEHAITRKALTEKQTEWESLKAEYEAKIDGLNLEIEAVKDRNESSQDVLNRAINNIQTKMSEREATLAQRESELNKLKEDLRATQTAAEAAENARASLLSATIKVETLTEQLATVKEQVSTLEAEKAVLQSELNETRAKVTELEDSIAITATQTADKISSLEQDLAAAMSANAKYESNLEDLEVMVKSQRILKEAAREDLSKKNAEYHSLQSELNQLKNKHQELQTQKQVEYMIKELTPEEIAKLEEKIRQLEEKIRELEGNITELESTINDKDSQILTATNKQYEAQARCALAERELTKIKKRHSQLEKTAGDQVKRLDQHQKTIENLIEVVKSQDEELTILKGGKKQESSANDTAEDTISSDDNQKTIDVEKQEQGQGQEQEKQKEKETKTKTDTEKKPEQEPEQPSTPHPTTPEVTKSQSQP